MKKTINSIITIVAILSWSSLAQANTNSWTYVHNVKVQEVSCADQGNFCYVRTNTPRTIHSRLCQNKTLFMFDGRSEGGKQLLALAMNAFNTQGNVTLVSYGLTQIDKPCRGSLNRLHRINLRR